MLWDCQRKDTCNKFDERRPSDHTFFVISFSDPSRFLPSPSPHFHPPPTVFFLPTYLACSAYFLSRIIWRAARCKSVLRDSNTDRQVNTERCLRRRNRPLGGHEVLQFGSMAALLYPTPPVQHAQPKPKKDDPKLKLGSGVTFCRRIDIFS